MPVYIKPFPSGSVQPHPPTEFHVGDGELPLFDSVANEHVRRIATPFDYWCLDTDHTKRDPLYDEPLERKWLGPFRLLGYLEYADGTPEVREEGKRTSWQTSAWISRKSFEDAHAPAPGEGDVLRVWNTNFFADDAVDGENISGAGFYMDVSDVDTDGHLADTPSFVGFKLALSRKTDFTPERRLRNQ